MKIGYSNTLNKQSNSPLYSKDPKEKTEKRLKRNEEKKKKLKKKFADKRAVKIGRQQRLNSNKEVRDLRSKLRDENLIAKWGEKNKRNDEYPSSQ